MADIATLKLRVDAAEAEASLIRFGNTAEKTGQRTEQNFKAYNQEINSSTRLLGQLISVTDRHDHQALQGLRELVQQQRAYLGAVGATAEQFLKLTAVETRLNGIIAKTQLAARSTSELGGHITTFQRSGVRAFDTVALAASNFASGSQSGLTSASNALTAFALGFGTSGIVGAALISGGEAIYNYFNRTREEMRKTRETFVEETQKMIRAGDQLGLQRSARDVFLGDPAAGPSAVRPGAFRGGLADLEAARRGVSYQLENAAALGKTVPQILALSNRLKELDAAIAPLKREFNDLANAIRNPPAYPTDITGLTPFEIHAKSPFAKPDKLRLAGVSLSPSLGDEVLRNAERGATERAALGDKIAADALHDLGVAAQTLNTDFAKASVLQQKALDQEIADEKAKARAKAASDRLSYAFEGAAYTVSNAAANFLIGKIGGGTLGGNVGGQVGLGLTSALGGFGGTAFGQALFGPILGGFGAAIGAGVDALFDFSGEAKAARVALEGMRRAVENNIASFEARAAGTENSVEERIRQIHAEAAEQREAILAAFRAQGAGILANPGAYAAAAAQRDADLARVDAAEKEYIARLRQEDATKANTAALNELTTSLRNSPSGFKIEPYTYQYGIARPNPYNSPLLPTPFRPLGGPTTTGGGGTVINMQGARFVFPDVIDPEKVGPAFIQFIDGFGAKTLGINALRSDVLEIAPTHG